jgi:S-formylglutathione hydrolase
MSVKVNTTIFVGGGNLLKVTHESKTLGLPANFNIYLPPAALGKSPQKVPVLIYLCISIVCADVAGLTCTADNCSEKGGFFNHLGKANIAMLLPDTSPRNLFPDGIDVGGAGVDGEEDSWDFGTGAGFYVDATQDGWNKNYKMYSYVTEELPALVGKEFPVDINRVSITGHSMGILTLDVLMKVVMVH